MSVQNAVPGQERQNRKILEQLEEEKKRLRLQQTKNASPATPPSTNSGVTNSTALSNVVQAQPTLPEAQHMTAAQRAALQHAHANSVGYFITQESAFGNLILPVLPRFEIK